MSYISRKRYHIVLVACIVLFGVRIGLGGFFASSSDITPQSIADGVNQQRISRNLSSLNYNSILAEAAQYKASDMIARNYFSHTDPDGNYIWPTIVADGYTPYTTLGENLAIDFPDTESLMSAWIDSPEHRANILNAAFQDQGAAVATGNGSNQYTDAMANEFGAQPPKAQATVPQPSSTTQASPTVPKTASPTVAQAPSPKTPTVPKAPSSTKTTPTSPTPPAAATSTSAPKTSPAPSTTPSSPTTPTPTTKPSGTLAKASVDPATVVITPTIQNNVLNLHVAFIVNGTVSSVTGSVLGVSTQFTSSGNGAYAGDLTLDKYTDYEKQNITLTVLDQSKNESDTSVALKNFPLPPASNPTSVTSIVQQIKTPDLYSVYKYIVGGFAVLFLMFMVADTVFFRRAKKITQHVQHWGDWNLPMILLIAGTALTVWWWH